jgi:tRNA (cytidine/uridine-2'-O-)-methyltransferase
VLVEPLGFRLSDRQLKRAGLDYWLGVDVRCVDNLESFLAAESSPFFLFSSKGRCSYTDVSYPQNALLIFGSETAGLPSALLEAHWERTVRIPMRATARCLNLSNSVAIGLYEAWRQQGFA